MNKPSQLEIFPDELFLELFSYISPCDLYHIWHGLNSRLNAILRSVRISFDLIENTDDNNRILNYFSQQIVYIHMRIPSKFLNFRQLLNLRSLVIDAELTKEQLECIQPTILPFLQRLTLTQSCIDQYSINEVVFNQQWLKIYHLSSLPTNYSILSTKVSYIQTMILDRITSFDIHLILSLQKTLRRLKVTIVSSLFDEKFSKITSYDQNYQNKYLIDFHTTMNTCNKINDLYSLLSHCSALRYLSIACDSLTIHDFQQLAFELNARVPWLERLNCSFRQTYIDDMRQLYSMSPLFYRMKCKKIEWMGGWHYYCITTENV